MFSSRSIMHLSPVLIISWAFMAMAAAQLHCDPMTQYEKESRCCRKCDPGTSMLPGGTCREPQCKECGENEYQEKYTTATRCERQEYCDPNKNFKWRDNENKKKRIPCLCKDGFHCSSEECLTCIPHRKCQKGFGARSIGNHTHDTVCEKCPDGEFSSNSTWYSVCQKWTVCKHNFHKSKEGTGESDVECAEGATKNIVIPAMICAVIVIILLILAVSIYNNKKGKKGYHDVTPKCDIETHLEEKKDVEILIDDKEDGPEENEDDMSLFQPSLSQQAGVTANGNFVTQEIGKSDPFPRQESQTDTTEGFCP